ncbi:hypothetical protein SAMN05880590_101489 [Rhizobium sp. RU35A]|uniref:Lipoprotein n=1 Tax=Rhizobium straminoryzae TaxID=1387186 RepID=A0A549TC23_9HYPH|nr:MULTISPECIES: hypothetical protein [Rhizobium]TRL39429.1 hypothetical protein FNA46_09825 [Rhizobium straminoryzae]SIP96669.1 hypothetical protein SAMN05880590_101489 [Rhizobium sp. RU35A]
MNTRLTALVLLACTLCGCTTMPTPPSPIETRWQGKSAGAFFARFAPPYADARVGDDTVYNWRGGFQRIKTVDGQRISASCSANLTTDSNYRIKSIHVVSDRPGTKGPSYCTELLTAE